MFRIAPLVSGRPWRRELGAGRPLRYLHSCRGKRENVTLKHPKVPVSSRETLSVPPLRELPRLNKQQAPAHDKTAAASFHH